ncbi:FtsW/RodA/SpoVE family cell cycle protein [Agriterribacter sp.]|uniref:FtsW/RodA/SpoVE family cell cycle protein n=1 Tax=Agriterribacter sp. TaxID=2821509 RepID=UPI002BFFAA86|nr:FtsW/RodA/SpoVE family cell cycle protein [Agriterribacter sp.]HTN06690.1 FtsW/RodA/SpoVE family cell cycle protein [Agriterribacter sp.]
MQALLNKTRGDKVIWVAVILLTLLSLLVIYSSTGTLAYRLSKSAESYLFKQFAFTAIGFMIIYFAHRINYTLYSRAALILFVLSIPLLIYTLFFGAEINEGTRWIKLPIINLTFQTSDLARLALFMYLSRQLSRSQNNIKDFKQGFLPLIIPVGIICVLIAPANLSTALLIGATSLLLMFIGRVSIKHIAATIGIALIPLIFLVSIAFSYYNKEDHQSKDLPAILSVGRIPTWIKRIQDFAYADKIETAYQVQQAKIAIAKGGWLGLGPGNSEQRNFLPHPYSDFIYAIIIEEYGLLGGVLILFLYLLFLFRSIRIFKKCPFAFGAFLALALSFTLVIQALVNMAVNVNLFPVTGVPLPLVSMGGSSFLFTCMSIGIILSVARNAEKMEGKAQLAAAE